MWTEIGRLSLSIPSGVRPGHQEGIWVWGHFLPHDIMMCTSLCDMMWLSCMPAQFGCTGNCIGHSRRPSWSNLVPCLNHSKKYDCKLSRVPLSWRQVWGCCLIPAWLRMAYDGLCTQKNPPPCKWPTKTTTNWQWQSETLDNLLPCIFPL